MSDISTLNIKGTEYAIKDKTARDAAQAIVNDGYIKTGSQTSISSVDGGSNVYTFTDSKGQTSTFIVKNGNKGSMGPTGPMGPTGAASTVKGPTGTKDKKIIGKNRNKE